MSSKQKRTLVVLPESRQFLVSAGDHRISGTIPDGDAGDELLRSLQDGLTDVDGVLVAKLPDHPDDGLRKLIRRLHEVTEDTRDEELGMLTTAGIVLNK